MPATWNQQLAVGQLRQACERAGRARLEASGPYTYYP